MTASAHPSVDAHTLEMILSWGVNHRLKPLRKLFRAIMESQDAEALHDLRVASRRLRTALLLMGPFVSDRHIKPVARRLKRLTRALGLPRELDIHVGNLNRLHKKTDAPEMRAAVEFLLEYVDQRRTSTRREMIRDLKGTSIGKLTKDIQAVTQRLPRKPGSSDGGRTNYEVLAPLIEHAFAGLSALRQNERPDELHQMRIAVKRLRYALEWTAPAARGGFAAVIQRLVALQDCIGRHHDAYQLMELTLQVEGELRQHGRATLAQGLRLCRRKVGMQREKYYAQFLAVTIPLTASAIQREVRTALEDGDRRGTIPLSRKVGT